ncbi:DUF1697 domain-containing protein [Chryseobacterium sp. CT-SW4]|uniref:DUF1697 domain-containing protein n=1 Tax=Chryseobacterium sp. SW-1 TaxID=3157343 RepID=UPI003B01822F
MRYCAFLRGVNVKGTNMKMAEVCEVFSNEGMEDVSSVLASGNIIFSSEEMESSLKVKLEKAMSEHFSYEAFLFLRTKEEIENIWNKNPFEKKEDFHIYAFIGASDIENILMQEFENTVPVEDEKGCILDNTFYWQVPKGNTLGSTFGKVLGKKSLKDRLTSRNISTFDKVLKKM